MQPDVIKVLIKDQKRMKPFKRGADACWSLFYNRFKSQEWYEQPATSTVSYLVW